MGETLVRTQNRKIFAQKRILRLYPALWVNIVLTMGMLSLLPGVVSGHGKDLLTWAVVQGVGLAYTPSFFAGVCDRKHQRDALGADGGNSAVRSGCGGLETVSCLERPYLACPPGADCAVKFRLRLFKGFGSASGRSCFPAGSKLPAVSGLVFAGLYLWHFKETILQKLTGKWFILLIVFICYKVCWQTFGWKLPGYYADLVTSLLLPGGCACLRLWLEKASSEK